MAEEHGGDDKLWQEKGGKLQKNQIHCQKQRRATERSWLWSLTCWRVSIQPDKRNSWQNMGSQAEAKVSSGGISRPLLQKKGKAGRREKAQNSQHLWKACKNICRQNLYELKTGSSSLEVNSKAFNNKMSGNTHTWQQQKDGTVKWWPTRLFWGTRLISSGRYCNILWAELCSNMETDHRGKRTNCPLWLELLAVLILNTGDWPRPLGLLLIPPKNTKLK